MRKKRSRFDARWVLALNAIHSTPRAVFAASPQHIAERPCLSGSTPFNYPEAAPEDLEAQPPKRKEAGKPDGKPKAYRHVLRQGRPPPHSDPRLVLFCARICSACLRVRILVAPSQLWLRVFRFRLFAPGWRSFLRRMVGFLDRHTGLVQRRPDQFIIRPAAINKYKHVIIGVPLA